VSVSFYHFIHFFLKFFLSTWSVYVATWCLKKSFKAYAIVLSLISTQMQYDISKQDFADLVRQVNNWKDLAILCGCNLDGDGRITDSGVKYVKQKAINMRSNINHCCKARLSGPTFITICQTSLGVLRVTLSVGTIVDRCI
jgi:hypothetical protein